MWEICVGDRSMVVDESGGEVDDFGYVAGC